MKILPGYLRKKKSPEVPSGLLKKIRGLSSTRIKRAIFDLDNTILNGDIGDAIFCRLKNLEMQEKVRVDGKHIGLTWKDYTGMIAKGSKEKAYRTVTECMEYIPVSLIADLTRGLMNSDFRHLEHSGEKIPIPHIDPGMRSLIDLLKNEKFDIYVISASNSISVKIIADEYLGLEKEKAFGIESERHKNKDGRELLSKVLKEPVPVNIGKANLYSALISENMPLITSGDSELDLPMLNLVDEGGLVLWRGEDDRVSDRLKDLVGGRAEVISLMQAGFTSGV
ncbi:MAG: HAD family hydrolase [Acidobacteriota bacterium]